MSTRAGNEALGPVHRGRQRLATDLSGLTPAPAHP